jgi:hypothetical protein
VIRPGVAARVAAIDRLIQTGIGTWAWGWGWQDYGGDDHMVIRSWCCADHSLFPEGYSPDQVAPTAARIIAGLREWRDYLETLERLYAAATIPDDPVAGPLAMAAAVTRIITTVIEVTECNDAWYGCAIDAVGWFFEYLGLVAADARQIASTTFDGKFESWVAPDETTRELTVHDASGLAYDALKRIRDRARP